MQGSIPGSPHHHPPGVDPTAILQDDFSEFRAWEFDEIRPFAAFEEVGGVVGVTTLVSKAIVDLFGVDIEGKHANFGRWHAGEILLGEAPVEPDDLETKLACGWYSVLEDSVLSIIHWGSRRRIECFVQTNILHVDDRQGRLGWVDFDVDEFAIEVDAVLWQVRDWVCWVRQVPAIKRPNPSVSLCSYENPLG